MEIIEYVEGEAGHGEIAYTEKDDNPLIIRLHDTYRIKFHGRLHIDIISGEFHLMLDRENASKFLDFIKNKRKCQKDLNKRLIL